MIFLCRKRKQHVLVLVLGFIYSALLSQEPVFKNYTTEEGLPSNEVYGVIQDSKGFIWFGTDGGVSRFDGYKFTNFTSAQGLTDNTIFELQEDRHGRIWFRTLSGKLCYSLNDSIISIDANDSITANLSNDLLGSFYIDSGDTLWCGGRAAFGIMKIIPPYEKKDFEIIKLPTPGPFVFFIEKDAFVYGVNRGESSCSNYSFYRKNKLVYDFPNKVAGHLNIRYGLVDDATYLSNDNELLCIRDGKSEKILDLSYYFNSKVLFIKSIDSIVWMGLSQKGVINFIASSSVPVISYSQLLKECSVTNIIKDSEGGMWFTTLEHGVYYASADHFTLNIKNDKAASKKSFHLSSITDSVMCITSRKGFVNLALNDTIVNDLSFNDAAELNSLFNKNNISIPVLIKTGNNHEQENYLNYILFGKKNWFVPLCRKNGQPVPVFSYASDFLNKKMFITDRFNLYTLREEKFAETSSIALPARTFDIETDNKGVLWLGTINGLWSFHKEKFIHHGNRDVLLNARINDIVIAKDDTRFFATLGNGLIIQKNNKYYNITIENGLLSNNCECLFLDSYERLWIGTKSGICSIDLKNKQEDYTNLLVSNGELLGKKINQIVQCANMLWVNTDIGLVTHALPVIENSVLDPPLYITEYFVNDRSYSRDTNRVFKYYQNNIKISFVALHYQRFGKLNYEYKLQGIDSKWNRTQSTTVQYPYLPPGKYTFFVRVASDNGKYKNNASIHFFIQKPLWERVWFRTLIVAGIVIIIGFFFLDKINRIKKKEEEKTRINKQIADLEMKALRAQMNPHFIFNAMNSVQNYILKNERMIAQDYLAKFARLVRNVLDNSKAETISLFNEIETLKLYLELEQLRAPGKFSFSIRINEELQLKTVMIPPLLIQPFIENAILHGLVHKRNKEGKIELSITWANQHLVCIVDDNGIGRKKSQEIKSSRDTLHRSFGLEATQERIEIINSQPDKSASIRIEDKEGEAENPTGTRVTITIPFIIK